MYGIIYFLRRVSNRLTISSNNNTQELKRTKISIKQ